MGCFYSKTVNDAVVVEQKPQQYHPAVTGVAPSSSKPHTENDNGISPCYKKLPSDAVKVTVRNVYDGDTVTLTDERRVRLLGIDTPEIKEKQPFALESKQYTSNLCNKKQIWISHEPNYEKVDHYGRLLAWIYVASDNGKGYMCVNEGIVCEGLASVYIPNASTKLQRQNKLFTQQKMARDKKLYIWKKFSNNQIVIITRNGTAYHSSSCKHIENSKNTIKVKASEALDKGLHPCRTCQS